MFRDCQRIVALPSADAEYRFGKPKTYLTAHELARLVLLRSRLGDTQPERAAEKLSTAPRRTTRISSTRQALHDQQQSRSDLGRSRWP